MKFFYMKYCKGQVAVIVALSLIVLVGMVGLAVDSGLGYGVKAKLNAAVDAASLAGARALSQGGTQAEQGTAATQAANKFFHANYPDGYLGSTPTEPVVTVSFLPSPNCTPPRCGTIVDVSASASVPVTFMRVYNFDLLNVSASASADRQSVDLAFVVDITGSMSGVASSVRSRAQKFLNNLNQESDRVTLISFNEGAKVNDPIRTTTHGFDRTTMQTHIGNFNFAGYTNFGEAFWLARNQLNSVPTSPLGNRSNLRVIVFFTDGSPNTFASTFPVRRMSTPDSTCGGSTPTCNCTNISTNAGKCTSPTSRNCSCTCTGSLASNDGSSGTPDGLFNHELTNESYVSGTCNRGSQIVSTGTSDPGIYDLPIWYNAPHAGATPNIPLQEFNIEPAPSGPPSAPPQLRTIATTVTYATINRASRNQAEEMAWVARNEGIYVFVLGLGDNLHGQAGPDNEVGEKLLKCMANTNDGGDPSITPLSRCYTDNQTNNRNQPTGNQTVGTYCWAKDDASLSTCYEKLASQILRLLGASLPPP